MGELCEGPADGGKQTRDLYNKRREELREGGLLSKDDRWFVRSPPARLGEFPKNGTEGWRGGINGLVCCAACCTVLFQWRRWNVR